MALEDFKAFSDIVESDPVLADQLWQANDRSRFVALTIELAEARGIAVTPDDVDRAIERGRLRWLQTWNP